MKIFMFIMSSKFLKIIHQIHKNHTLRKILKVIKHVYKVINKKYLCMQVQKQLSSKHKQTFLHSLENISFRHVESLCKKKWK